jgi:hypothetical protein
MHHAKTGQAKRPAPSPYPPSLIAMRISGDLAGYTYYQTRRGQTVGYPAAPPKEPPTPSQLAQRQRFRDAAANWQALSQAHRDAWERMSLRCHLMATGYDCWIHFSLTGNERELAALARRGSEDLQQPPKV